MDVNFWSNLLNSIASQPEQNSSNGLPLDTQNTEQSGQSDFANLLREYQAQKQLQQMGSVMGRPEKSWAYQNASPLFRTLMDMIAPLTDNPLAGMSGPQGAAVTPLMREQILKTILGKKDLMAPAVQGLENAPFTVNGMQPEIYQKILGDQFDLIKFLSELNYGR